MTGCWLPCWGLRRGYIREQRFGVMCAMVNGQVVPVELEKVAGKLKKRCRRTAWKSAWHRKSGFRLDNKLVL